MVTRTVEDKIVYRASHAVLALPKCGELAVMEGIPGNFAEWPSVRAFFPMVA